MTYTSQPPELEGKSVTVVGLGKSGIGAARLLQLNGAQVTLADEQHETALQDRLKELSPWDFQVCMGKEYGNAFHSADLIVISPGVPSSHPYLEAARQRGTWVVGELELASWYIKAPIIAVTGTNGKSTTVRMIGQILEESGKKIFLGGNLGTPLCEAVLSGSQSSAEHAGTPSQFDYVVVEVSSFQLETIERFRPWIASVLNITLDHMDRYPSWKPYWEAKQKIFKNQAPEDFALVNMDDPEVLTMTETTRSTIVGFSLRIPLEQGVYIEGDFLKARLNGTSFTIARKGQIRLRGNHNLANILAAIGLGLLCKCPVEVIQKVVRTFPGIEHALEFVREREGVLFYNDSKATNIDATINALGSFDEPINLILGGKNKGGDFTRLGTLIRQKVKHLVVMGEASPEITKALNFFPSLSAVESLSDAVRILARQATKGEVVLLSPACASFDMFKDYADRGEQFRKLIHSLG